MGRTQLLWRLMWVRWRVDASGVVRRGVWEGGRGRSGVGRVIAIMGGRAWEHQQS